MLQPSDLAAAAEQIWSYWNAGEVFDRLPDYARPETRADGYAIQSMITAKSARGPIGWKIAATSKAGQMHIGVDGPLAGRLIGERSHSDGVTLSLTGNRMRVAEPEFAFRIGRSLGPRSDAYTVAEVMDAVDALMPAIEVPDSRFSDFASAGLAQLIADCACAHEFVLGRPTSADWRAIDLASYPVLASVGQRYSRDGVGSNVLGDPRVALTWIANELSSLGITLSAGEVVTTGTCMPPLAIEPGDQVEADFGVLGRISARFS